MMPHTGSAPWQASGLKWGARGAKTLRQIVFLWAGFLIACARAISPAPEALNWKIVEERQMILVDTKKPNGDLRTTRLWIVVHNGFGYLRSADTRWSRDLEREPQFQLIVDELSYPVRGTRVPYGGEEHAAVMDAFWEKYGVMSRMTLRFYKLIGRYSEPSDAKIFRLEIDSPGGPE